VGHGQPNSREGRGLEPDADREYNRGLGTRMVNARRLPVVALLALVGPAYGQDGQDEGALGADVLEELQSLASFLPDLQDEIRILRSIEAEIQRRDAAAARPLRHVRDDVWSSALRKLASAYRETLREEGELPVAAVRVLLLSMPCTASGADLPTVRDLLTREDYSDLADQLVRRTNTPSERLLGHLCKLHLGDRNERIRHALMLARVEPASEVVPHLMEELEDEDARVLQETITALGAIGPPAKAAIPALEKLAEHEDPQIAERAKAALRQIRDA
jgi:hypothetical protein